jgi:hypothetical protein
MRKPKPSRYIACALLLILAPSFPVHAGLKEWASEKVKKQEKLDAKTVAAGLRQALEQGTQQAVGALGRENGFWKHPTLRIPVPEKLVKVERGLRRIGQDKVADDFVRSLNRAAEQATPAARDIFVNAIRKMTVRDAMDILKGSDDAATLYFRRHTEAPLISAFKPIVTRSTEAVGVTAHYKRFVKKAQPLGLVDTRNLDIDDYVTRKALDGLFSLVAEEEKRIRKDPVARTTELLRKVFGNN